ncbi:MAG: hypothetical protein ACI4R8_03440 [Candidatus Caccovivens sp.]
MTKKKSLLTFVFAICLIVPALFMLTACGHTHSAVEEWSSDATYHWHTCEGCEELLDKAEHTWNAGEITTPATETTQAVKTYTCTVCAKTKTEAVAKADAGLSFSASYNPSKEYDVNYAEEPVLGVDYTCASDGEVTFAWYEKIGDTYSEEPLSEPYFGLCAPYEVGTYKLVMSVAETKNYSSAKVEKEGIVISPRQITITNTNLTKVYGTSGKIDDCSFGLDEIIYKVSTEEGGLYAAEGSELYLKVQMDSKNVGADILNMGFVMDGFENLNYALANAADITAEIKHATLTFTQETITKEYDATSTFTYTFTTEDGLKDGTTCTLSFTVKDADDNDIKNAGEYTNFVVDDKNATLSNSNYKVNYTQSPIFTNNGGKLVITQKVITELDIILSVRTGTSVQVSPRVPVGNTTENVFFKITVTSESVWNHATELTLVLEKPLSTQAMIEIVSDTNYILSKNFVGTLTITASES